MTFLLVFRKNCDVEHVRRLELTVFQPQQRSITCLLVKAKQTCIGINRSIFLLLSFFPVNVSTARNAMQKKNTKHDPFA